MIKNIDRIKDYFHDHTNGVQAMEVAEVLGIKRNVASALMNELVKEGFLRKEKSKPVIFYPATMVQQKVREKALPTSDYTVGEAFKEYSNPSYEMEQILNKCKISVTYPGRGIPIMLLGASGVGKSTLARKIYLYAKERKKITEQAPFVIFNCADYANNKELLSSILFGYKKGAFTGAIKDTAGVFEQANDGYLFLDEVHRLPPEGQEKLFSYIDTGIVTPLGDETGGKERNVRLIFATTEKVGDVMLETFNRRVPITVQIPTFDERNSNERMDIICNLFYDEAVILDCDFNVSNNVIQALLGFKGKGNIGTLKNIIKISCAMAVSRQVKEDPEVEVTLEDLINQYPAGSRLSKKGNSYGWTTIHKQQGVSTVQLSDSVEDILQIDLAIHIINKYLNGEMNEKTFTNRIRHVVDNVADYLVYNIKSSSIEMLYSEYVENILKFIYQNYGINYTGTTILLLTKLLVFLNQNRTYLSRERENQLTKAIQKCEKYLYRQFRIADIFFETLNQTLDYNSNKLLLKLFYIFYLCGIMEQEEKMCSGIIIAHGYSTASSIASLVNQLYSRYIFDSFDMPYRTTKEEVVKQLREYLKNVDTTKGIILLVDMGSIWDLTDDIADLVKGNIGIMNNVTSEMALAVAGDIIQKQDLELCLKKTVSYNSTVYRFLRKREKENVILISCLKDIKLAEKIRDILEDCFIDKKIRVLEYNYEKLLREDEVDNLNDIYNVLLIVSTNELVVKGLDVLLFNNLLRQEGEEILKNVLHNLYTNEEIDIILDNIIKNLSLTNIMSKLTILNPEILINDVQQIIHSMELQLVLQFAPDLKQLLYMHIGVMVERLMQEKGEVSKNTFEKFAMCHKNFTFMVKKNLSVIEDHYHIEVNNREIKLIYDIIESKTEGFKMKF